MGAVQWPELPAAVSAAVAWRTCSPLLAPVTSRPPLAPGSFCPLPHPLPLPPNAAYLILPSLFPSRFLVLSLSPFHPISCSLASSGLSLLTPAFTIADVYRPYQVSIPSPFLFLSFSPSPALQYASCSLSGASHSRSSICLSIKPFPIQSWGPPAPSLVKGPTLSHGLVPQSDKPTFADFFLHVPADRIPTLIVSVIPPCSHNCLFAAMHRSLLAPISRHPSSTRLSRLVQMLCSSDALRPLFPFSFFLFYIFPWFFFS